MIASSWHLLTEKHPKSISCLKGQGPCSHVFFMAKRKRKHLLVGHNLFRRCFFLHWAIWDRTWCQQRIFCSMKINKLPRCIVPYVTIPHLNKKTELQWNKLTFFGTSWENEYVILIDVLKTHSCLNQTLQNKSQRVWGELRVMSFETNLYLEDLNGGP